MNVSFEQLKSMVVFAQVVEQGTLSSAAKKLNISRAVVSYHIKKLESHIGITLLNRSTRAISLTEAGHNYYQFCRQIAEQASAANQKMENLKAEPIGLLKVTCPVNVGLEIIVPALNKFMKLYPKITLDINLTDDVVDIVKEGIDLAIRGATLSDSNLQATKLFSLQNCLCAAPQYLANFGIPTAPAELAVHQWVMYKQGPKSIELSKGSRSYSIEMKGKISTNNAAAKTAFTIGGHGIARIPLYDAKPKLKTGELIRVLEDYQLNDITVFGVFPPGNADAKKLRLLIEFLKQYAI